MPVIRFKDRLKFVLERRLQRGARTQLLFIAAVIVLIAFLGGVVAWAFSDQFDRLGHAVWWAFLRLTDPGYLGDDEGALLRTVSTVITVMGYVVFLGSLVAILTRWLQETMRKLESGLTPIAISGHILILGWTNRTPTIVQELVTSEARVRRFLRRRGARRFRIVILAESVGIEQMVELRETLGVRWDERRIILRSGTSMRIEHLRRVAYRTASVIIIPGADFALGGAAATDARTVKTLISLSSEGRAVPRDGPTAVAEIFDVKKAPIAENAYHRGAIDVVASNAFISRLIAQNVRHRGLSYLYSELLTHEQGNEIYVRGFPGWEGRSYARLRSFFPKAVLIGVVRLSRGRFEPHLNPPPEFNLARDDRLVLIARTYEDCEPERAIETTTSSTDPSPAPVESNGGMRRVLVLGWSHRVLSLLEEFSSYPDERFIIDLVSCVEIKERKSLIGEEALSDRVTVHHVQGDYTVRDTLVGIRPGEYDNVVFLASDWLDSEEESDARTVLGYVLLRSLLETSEEAPEMVIELMDPANASLFRRRGGEVIVSPLILSHILAHVALRRELGVVVNELFGAGGAEFFFRRAGDYGLDAGTIGFDGIQAAAQARGETAIGVRIWEEFQRSGRGMHVNPPRNRRWQLQSDDEIVVVTAT